MPESPRSEDDARRALDSVRQLWGPLLPGLGDGSLQPTRKTLLILRDWVYSNTLAARERPPSEAPDWRPHRLADQVGRVLPTASGAPIEGLACAGRQLLLLIGCRLVGIPARRASLFEEVHQRKFEADRDPRTGGLRNASGEWVGRNHRSHSMVEARPLDQDRFTLQDAHFNCEVTDASGRLLDAFEAVHLCRGGDRVFFETNGFEQRPHLDNDYLEREYPPHLLYRYAARGRAFVGDEPSFFPRDWDGVISYAPGPTRGPKPDTDLRSSLMSPVLGQFLLERD